MPWWDVSLTEWFIQRNDNRVAPWPLAGGARVGGRHVMVGGDPPCASRASRHLVTFAPFPGGVRYFALIDVAYDGTPGELAGDTGEDSDGRVLELKITDHQIGNPHPDYSEAGLNYLFTLSLPGKDDWHIEWFWPTIQDGGIGPAPQSLMNVQAEQVPARRQNDPCTADNAWENTVCSEVDWYTFSECVQPAGEELVLVENFARFNGIDSYIALTDEVARFNSPFRVEYDFRFQGQPDWAPVFGLHAMGGFFGFDKEEVIFGFFRIPTSWVPIVNRWYHMRVDFEQVSQLNLQLFVDDQVAMDSIIIRQQMEANRLGVYRHTVPGTIWGHFDLKHLTYRKGTPGDYDTQLDMPLQTNALDLGPFENHGTTFNMELPSV